MGKMIKKRSTEKGIHALKSSINKRGSITTLIIQYNCFIRVTAGLKQSYDSVYIASFSFCSSSSSSI